MANFPTSLDTLTNPTSGNTLDSPSHSLQHSDANDILEALEAKVGIGTSTAGSATAGHALVASTGGTTSWTTIGTAGITSGTATNGQVLTANGSGAVTFNTLPSQGLTLIYTTTFSGVTSISAATDSFTSTYANYRILFDATAVGGDETISCRLRSAGSDDTVANYDTANYSYTAGNSAAGFAANIDLNRWLVGEFDGGSNNHSYSISMDMFRPKEAVFTTMSMQAQMVKTDGTRISIFGGGWKKTTTAYDSISFVFTANTSGRLSIYGYNN
jgi:hypothetical protein